VKSELRKKEKQLEESREENLRLKMEAGRTRDGSPGFGGQSSRGDSPSSSGSGAGSELDNNEAGEPERGGSDDEKDALSKALAENASLKKFLRDYGMTWVGDESSADASVVARGDETGPDDDFGARRGKKVQSSRLRARAEAARANKHSADAVLGPTGANANAPAIPGRVAATNATTTETFSVFSVDVEKLLASIAELNAVAGDGKSSVVVGANGERRLEAPNAKTLTLFRDGFVVDDAPKTFRSFAEETNRSYVRDLVDGFFPYEYKEAHPNGVPFKLVDKSLENGAPADAFVAFTGGGARLDGKASKETSGQFLREIKKEPEPNRNRKDVSFLEKLPRVVVRDGAVVHVRESVGAAMRGGSVGAAPKSSTQTVLETTVARGCFRALLEREGIRSSADGGVLDDSTFERSPDDAHEPHVSSRSTLRVKGMDGQKMYIVKLAADDTVGKLRRYLRSAGAGDDDKGCESQNFEIRNAYPPRTFADDALTLRDAGLVPNATLLLRPA
jgi:hypothetical protein